MEGEMNRHPPPTSVGLSVERRRHQGEQSLQPPPSPPLPHPTLRCTLRSLLQ